MVALKRSTYPLACGWYPVIVINLAPRSFQSAAKISELSWSPLFIIAVDGVPKLATQCSVRILTVPVAVVFVFRTVIASLE